MDKKPEKLVPEVRFKGFTDDWEQHKLGEVAKVTMGQSPSSKNYTDNPNDYVLVQGNADLKSNEISPRVWTKEVTKKVHKGEFIMTVRAPVGYLATANMDAVIGRGVAAIDGNKYLYYLLQTKLLDRTWEKLSSGSTFESISSNDIKNLEIKVTETEEEKLIAKLMDTVTYFVTLQQRKLEQLKLLEKALQQKLFPNSFQEKPLLRILHGDNSWWNSYIGEVFTERVDKGSSEKLLSVSITDGVYPFDESKRKNNSSNDKHNYKKVFQNDIAYNSMRLWQGALGVSKYEGIVSPAYTVLKPLANQNSIFYEFMFKNIDMLHIFQRNSQGLTSDTWNLKFNQLQHIKIKTTNLNSQNKIAKLLIKIEELKNNESNYYHNLMILKKYLLQKLFI